VILLIIRRSKETDIKTIRAILKEDKTNLKRLLSRGMVLIIEDHQIPLGVLLYEKRGIDYQFAIAEGLSKFNIAVKNRCDFIPRRKIEELNSEIAICEFCINMACPEDMI